MIGTQKSENLYFSDVLKWGRVQQQNADWIGLLEKGAVKNVSVPGEFWYFLGNDQPKVSRSYPPNRWGSEELADPSYFEDNLKALRLAFDLFELGRTKEKREEFVSLLTKESSMKNGWHRNLVMEI